MGKSSSPGRTFPAPRTPEGYADYQAASDIFTENWEANPPVLRKESMEEPGLSEEGTPNPIISPEEG